MCSKWKKSRQPLSAAAARPVAGILAVSLGMLFLDRANAAEPPQTVRFAEQVRPLLAHKCFVCHGPGEQEGSLRLDQREAALAELDSGQRAGTTRNRSGGYTNHLNAQRRSSTVRLPL